MFDADTHKFLYVNRDAVEQAGHSANQLMDMTVLDIEPEFDNADFDAYLIKPIDIDQTVAAIKNAVGAVSGNVVSLEERRSNGA